MTKEHFKALFESALEVAAKNAAQLQKIMTDVYSSFPLPPH